jgi:hypothetical protein
VLPFTNLHGQMKTGLRKEETLLTKRKKSASSSRKHGSDQVNADTKRRKGESVITVLKMKQWSFVIYCM